MKRYWYLFALLLAAGLLAWFEPTRSIRGWLRGDPFFAGRSATYWEQAITAENPSVSDPALRALTDGGQSAVDVLCALLRRDSAPAEVRWNAAEIIGKSGVQSEQVSAALLEALKDADPHVRTVAADAVAKVNTDAEQAIPALTQLLETQADVPTIRALSVYREKAKPALERLVAIMQDRALPSEVRWNAVRTIGKMRTAGAEAVSALIPLMKDEEPTVREHAAEAVGDIGPAARDAIPALAETLEDSFHKARRDAVRSLGQVGPEASVALPAIERRLTDPEEIVREAARKTIETLTGKPPPRETPAPKDSP